MSDYDIYRTPEPKKLEGCIEFYVESSSSDPHLGGSIEIRCEPTRMGMRWHGTPNWTWMEYHEAIVIAGDLGKAYRELIKAKFEFGYEEGLRAGIEEATKPPEERKERAGLIYIPKRKQDI